MHYNTIKDVKNLAKEKWTIKLINNSLFVINKKINFSKKKLNKEFQELTE